jgi:hypothetical protein
MPTLAPIPAAQMTVAACAQAARNANMAVFGLQYGGECFMGNNITRAKSAGQLADERCGMPCGGDPTDACGAGFANR